MNIAFYKSVTLIKQVITMRNIDSLLSDHLWIDAKFCKRSFSFNGKCMEAVLAKCPTPSAEDKKISLKILKNLRRNAVVESPFDIRMIVSSGMVHLHGTVSMQAEKQMLEEIVRSTEGVVSVRNHLKLIPCSPPFG